jgi:3-hydroxyacyl-CoA dehydrogenase
MGRYGQKTNRGFYIYDPNTREKNVDEEVDKMFEQVAREKSIVRRNINDEEIIKRLSWALLNTGCMILEEGFALRASDIDVVYAYGYGYPAWRGGPMKYAENYGLDIVIKDIESFRKTGDGMWPVCKLLEDLANGKKKFNN